MSQRRHVSGNARWETIYGYSRAVRTGAEIHVSGTTAVDDDGNLVGAGDPYRQTQRIFEIIERALQDLGGELTDVVRTRAYVTSIDDWEEIGRAHRELFVEIRPAATLVEVSRLIDPEMRVEIEVDARVGSVTLAPS